MKKDTSGLVPRSSGFGADLEQTTEPDPINYWKPEEGDTLFGWIAGLREVPNNFYDPNKPIEGGNQPTQQVALVIEDQTDEPVLVYASGAVLRRLFERGPHAGVTQMRPPRVGDHIGLKRLADDTPRQRGQKGMKQFVLRIDPEPPAVPPIVAQAIDAYEAEQRAAARLATPPIKDDVSDVLGALPAGTTQNANGVYELPPDANAPF